MQYISSVSRAPRKQLATKAARKSAQIYGAEDYSNEENDSEVERSPSPVVPTEGAQRQELFTNLLTALWTPANLLTALWTPALWKRKPVMGHLLLAKQLNPRKAFCSILYMLREPVNCGSLSLVTTFPNSVVFVSRFRLERVWLL